MSEGGEMDYLIGLLGVVGLLRHIESVRIPRSAASVGFFGIPESVGFAEFRDLID